MTLAQAGGEAAHDDADAPLTAASPEPMAVADRA